MYEMISYVRRLSALRGAIMHQLRQNHQSSQIMPPRRSVDRTPHAMVEVSHIDNHLLKGI